MFEFSIVEVEAMVRNSATAKNTQLSRALPRRGTREKNHPAAVAHERRLSEVRALQLGRLLRHQRVRVVVNPDGDHVDLLYEQGGGRGDRYGDSDTLRPIMIRVGRNARDEDVLAEGGPRGIFGRYNDAIAKLRQLRIRVIAIAGRGPLTESLLEAHRTLSRLDELVRRRRAKYMPNGVARLAVLRHEISFLEARHERWLPIILAAEPVVAPRAARVSRRIPEGPRPAAPEHAADQVDASELGSPKG